MHIFHALFRERNKGVVMVDWGLTTSYGINVTRSVTLVN